MLKAIAWICIIGLAVASWAPGQEMARTGFNTRLEHTVAYLIAGIATIIAYRCAFAGILELGQLYIPSVMPPSSTG